MATEDNAKRLARLGKLMETLRELQAKTYEVAEEMNKILHGEAAMGDVLKQVEKAFSEEWKARYGTPYVWQYVKDRPHWKRLLKNAGSDEVLQRIATYFADGDDYIRRARHPFGLFVSKFNTLARQADESTLELSAPVLSDCRHQPPCISDQEHTRRKQQDVRAGAR